MSVGGGQQSEAHSQIPIIHSDVLISFQPTNQRTDPPIDRESELWLCYLTLFPMYVYLPPLIQKIAEIR